MLERLEREAWGAAGAEKGKAFIKESMDILKHPVEPLVEEALDYAVERLAAGADLEKTASSEPRYVVDWGKGLVDAKEEVLEILKERFGREARS